MVHNCRSQNILVRFQGCNSTSASSCNVRDSTFFRDFSGFQFYDTGQSHLVTNTIFQNCYPNHQNCVNNQCTLRIWQYLTHSDQFTPGLMQMTKNISYVNCNTSFLLQASSTPANGKRTVSGRDANWYDADGTVTSYFPGREVNIGSTWPGQDWWRFNDQCVNVSQNWICAMDPADSVGSVVMHWAPASVESQIGTVYCSNGAVNGSYYPCPIGALVTHFNRNEANGFPVALMARVTGPFIAASGGWFVRYVNGTPAVISFTDMQIDKNDLLHLAIPYPRGTTFNIYAQAPSWCNPSSSSCVHYFRAVGSVAEVRSAWGDAYFYDSNTQLLHIRLISLDSFPSRFATTATYNSTLIWNSSSTYSTYFSRGGLNLLVTGSNAFSVIINATNCATQCSYVPEATVPGVNGTNPYDGPAQTPVNWTAIGVTPQPTASPSPTPTPATTTTSPSPASSPSPSTSASTSTGAPTPTTTPTSTPATTPTSTPTDTPTSTPTVATTTSDGNPQPENSGPSGIEIGTVVAGIPLYAWVIIGLVVVITIAILLGVLVPKFACKKTHEHY